MDVKLNFLKTIAIMLVVSGHLNFTLIHSLPTYAFHIALFFFISGMLFNNKYNLETYLNRRFKSLMLPYILYCIVYVLITSIMCYLTGKFWGLPVTIYNECVIPFLTGHQLLLCCPLWFVPQLFITMIIYYVLNNIVKFNNTFCYLILAMVVIILSAQNDNVYLLLVYRTIFSLFFVHLGYLYSMKQIENKLFSIKYLIIFIPILCCICLRKYIPYLNVQGILNYSFCFMTFNKLWLPVLPIISSVAGIYAILAITKIFYRYIYFFKITKIINIVGQNTYHIMANHLLVFNILTYLILAIKGISFEIKNSESVYWVYSQETLKYFYFLFGMLVPITINLIIKALYKKCAKSFFII